MSKITDNLNKRRDALGLKIEDIVEALASRGVVRAYPTVAGWFNSSRGKRWNMDELKALLDVLQTDIDAITEGEVELVEEKVPAAIARGAAALSVEKQQIVLALIESMKGT